MKNVHLLIKPSSSMCNLNCRYCFYKDISNKREQYSYGFMKDSTLEAIIKKGIEYAEEECTIAFQGGEPTLIGLDFFKKVIQFQNKYNTKHIAIHNSIQTNGFVLNEEWVNFFKDNNFLVGLSLDGIKYTHDHNRIDPNGNSTFNQIMQTIHLFDSHNIEYNILTVVNKQTAAKANRIYNFYKKNNLKYLQFIPCLDPIGETQGQNDYSLTPKDYGIFLNTLFDLWYQDFKNGKIISIRQFENYIEMLLGYPPEACGMSGACGYQHVIESDGSVYPCDFYVLDEFCLGNLKESTFEEINSKRKEIQFIETSMSINAECKTCKYYPLCRGGCRRNRTILKSGELGQNYFCESYKIFFEHTAERMSKIAHSLAMQKYS